jgi:hypothetical protein
MEQHELSNDIVVSCPHCREFIIIEKLNCSIFRHGMFKQSGKQINPHSTKELCEFYINKGLIYGCGKPFTVVRRDTNKTNTNNSNPEFYTVVCDYI